MDNRKINMKLAQNFEAIEAIGLPSLKFSTFLDSSPAEIITGLLPYVFGVAGIILLFNIITSGLKMMTSQGEPKTLQAAQAKLSTSAIGILILFVSFWIVQLIKKFIGVNTILFN